MATQTQRKPSRLKWFRKKDSDEASEISLIRAQEAKDLSERLREKAQRSLGSKGSNFQSTLDATKACLIRSPHDLIKTAALEDIVALALTEATTAKTTWERDREHGMRKVGSALQRFAGGIANFVAGYSGVLEAVRHLGGTYAEAGYLAVSVLLIVAMHKIRNDDFITTQLESVVDCFPRINLLAEVYPGEEVERRVLEVHSEVIFFARDATDYFLHSSERILQSLKAEQGVVKERIQSIERSLGELNAWTTVFMHRRVHELLKINQDQSEKLDDQTAKIEDLQLKLRGFEVRNQRADKQKASKALELVRVALGRPDENVNSSLQECVKKYRLVFPTNDQSNKRAARYMQMSTKLLEHQKSFRSWTEARDRSLLILGGQTKPEGLIQPSGYSWLSPAATLTTQRLQGDADNIVGFFSCHPDPWLKEEEKVSLSDLVAGLLFQVLKAEHLVLMDNLQEQLGNLSIESWQREAGRKGVRCMMESVTQLLQEISVRRRIFFVVDRAECCTSGLRRLIEWFLELVVDGDCRLKVLVVYDTLGSDMTDSDWEGLLEDSEGEIFVKNGWDQDKPEFQEIPLRQLR